jgi:hypothetical protein
MQEPYLSWPEAAWLIMQYTICANYLFVPQMLYVMAGRSSWIVPLIALVPAMAGSWAVYRLHKLYPADRLGQFLPQIAGKALGVAMGLLYCLFWMGGAAINTMLFAHYVSATILGFTPLAVHALINAALAVMVTLYGLKTLVRFTDALLLPIGLFLAFVWVGAILNGRLDFSYLRPFRIAELSKEPLNLVMAAISLYHGYFVILIAGPALNPPGRSAFAAASIGTLLAVPAFVSFVAYPVALFGWPMAADFTYPAGSFMEMLAPEVPNFPIRRFDFILSMFFRFIMVIASVTHFYSAAQTLSDLASPKAERIHPALTLAMGALIAVSYLLLTDLHSVLMFARVWLAIGTVLTLATIALAVRGALAAARGEGGC